MCGLEEEFWGVVRWFGGSFGYCMKVQSKFSLKIFTLYNILLGYTSLRVPDRCKSLFGHG